MSPPPYRYVPPGSSPLVPPHNAAGPSLATPPRTRAGSPSLIPTPSSPSPSRLPTLSQPSYGGPAPQRYLTPQASPYLGASGMDAPAPASPSAPLSPICTKRYDSGVLPAEMMGLSLPHGVAPRTRTAGASPATFKRLGSGSASSTSSGPSPSSSSPSPSNTAAATAGPSDFCHVTVRLRPPTAKELAMRQPVVWDADLVRNVIAPEPFFVEKRGKPTPQFHFDTVLVGSDNRELYETTAQEVVWAAMEGISGTVFAYGESGSGKTFSMMGHDAQPGVIPQAVDDVFNFIREQSADREFLLRVSYLEIYKEAIHDLLAPAQQEFRIHEDKKRGVYVSPLKEEIVTTPKQCLKIIQRGEANRHVGKTDYNERSSRSHTIFQIVIESRTRTRPLPHGHAAQGHRGAAGGNSARYGCQGPPGSPVVQPHRAGAQGAVMISSLNLIDLAGSEKAASNLDRRREGAYINRSLLTLGNVIAKLTEERSHHIPHIPFRDSKLTRILQNALSGKAKIAVICTVSPSWNCGEETINTLKFANRVKQVEVRPQQHRIIDDKALLQKYKVEIDQLRTQLLDSNRRLELERASHQARLEALSVSSGGGGPGGMGGGGMGGGSSSSPGGPMSDTERARYEEQLHEAQLVRTALKERIDHLTKMILTSSSITPKPILNWNAAAVAAAAPEAGGRGPRYSADDAAAGPGSGAGAMNDSYSMDLSATAQAAADAMPTRRRGQHRVSVMTVEGLLPSSDSPSFWIPDPTGAGSDAMSYRGSAAGGGGGGGGSSSAPARRLTDGAFIRKHIEEIDARDTRIAQLEAVLGQCRAATDVATVRGRIATYERDAQRAVADVVALRQREQDLSRHMDELEIVVQEQDAKIQSLVRQQQQQQQQQPVPPPPADPDVAFRTSLHYQEMKQQLMEQSEQLRAAEAAQRHLQQTISDLRHQVRRLEIAQDDRALAVSAHVLGGGDRRLSHDGRSSSGRASVDGVDGSGDATLPDHASSVAVVSQRLVREAEAALARERRLRRDEHARAHDRIGELEAELTIAKNELSVAQLIGGFGAAM